MAPELRRDAFQGLADPRRREILDLLATDGTLPVNSIADRFEVSRPAVSRHMKILAECGLVIVSRKGRQRYCAIRPDGLKEVADWTERHRKYWTDKLDKLEKFLNEKERGDPAIE